MLPNGFPYDDHPTGWFQVAWDAEVANGDVRPLHYFGTDLVLYRDVDGRFHVLDGHCPHMGAHLGHGGKVEACNLVCPFHGWTWDPMGQNVAIPGEDKPNRSHRLRAWPTEVRNGAVFVWHDAMGREPQWRVPDELPALQDPAYYPIHPHCSKRHERVRVHPQWIVENNADLSHLRTVHRAAGPIEQEFTTDGPVLRSVTSMTFGHGKPSSRLTPDGPQDGRLVAELWGLGIIMIRFAGIDDAWLLQCQTPIDAQFSDIWQSVVVPRPEGATGDAPEGLAKARVAEQIKQLERDFPIWENMRYVTNGPLTRTEAAHIAPLRRWARQFYPENSEDVPGATPEASAGAAPAGGDGMRVSTEAQ